MSDTLPEGCSSEAEVFGTDGRVWLTGVVLGALVAAWLAYGLLTDHPSYVRSVWFPAGAAAFVLWLQWDASRKRVILDRDRLWVRRRRAFEGPLDYADVIAATVGHPRGGISFYLANSVGVGSNPPRTLSWGFDNDHPISGRLATASVLSVPRLARTATNTAVYAALGRKLLAAGAPLAPHAEAAVQRAIDHR